MNNKIGFKKKTIIEGLVIAFMIVITIKLLAIINIKEAWTASIALLFYFEGKAKNSNIKNIFVGGLAGLAFSAALIKCIEYIIPYVGEEAGIFIPIFLFVFLIIAFGDVSHTIFNNYTFCYFTIASIFGNQQLTSQWIIGLIGGGGLLICSAILIMRFIPENKLA